MWATARGFRGQGRENFAIFTRRLKSCAITSKLAMAKKKLSADGVELVSVTHEFKFEAPDGKKRAADALDNACVEILSKHYPNNRAHAFLDWFTYSDNTIDGQSKKKAYTFMDSNLVANEDVGQVKFRQQIHAYIFGGLYDK